MAEANAKPSSQRNRAPPAAAIHLLRASQGGRGGDERAASSNAGTRPGTRHV
jgi:hypothetical protein